MPELSYCIVPYPHVLGPADAGTAELTANANARARVILLNMVILLVLKPEMASADQIVARGVYFRPRIRMAFARYTSSWAPREPGSHKRQR